MKTRQNKIQPIPPALLRLGLVAATSVSLISCGQKRSVLGPWEYGELTSVATRQLTNRVGAYANAVKPTDTCRTEVGFTTTEATTTEATTTEATTTAADYAKLLVKLGCKAKESDGSVALLNHLDSEGWELVTHAVAFDNEPMVVQDGDLGANLSEMTIDRQTWTFRRAR